MNLFFYIVNNIIMKKIVLFLLLFLSNFSYIYAIENIEIDGEYLIPKFDKEIKQYNHFTTNDIVKINIDKSSL